LLVSDGGGTERPSTTGDLRRFCLEMSNSASLDHLAVYDQPTRKLSVQVCLHHASLAVGLTVRKNDVIRKTGSTQQIDRV